MKRILVAVLLSAGLSGCAGGDGATIAMTDERAYDPETLTIPVGETVTWVNESAEAHSVTAYGEELPTGTDYFSSSGFSTEAEARDHIEALMTRDETYSVKFDEPGVYEYFCIPHEDQGMRGRIVVES